MLRGLPASIIVHSAVFAMAYVGLPYFGFGTSTYISDIDIVDVDFVEIGTVTNIAAIFSPPDPEEGQADALPEPETRPDDPVMPETPDREDVPLAQETILESKTLEADRQPPEDLMPDFEVPETRPEDTPPKPEPEPILKPRPRPVDPLADFLNQSESTFKSEIETRQKRVEPPPPPAEPKTEPKLKDAAPRQIRKSAGARTGNIARLESLVVSRIRNECWVGVDDLPNPERLNVQMRVLLNQNGTIADLRLVSPGRRPLGRSPMGTAIDRALRAVNKCAPYRLPSEEYANWQEMNVYLGLGFVRQ